jgi:hypothetical protein
MNPPHRRARRERRAIDAIAKHDIAPIAIGIGAARLRERASRSQRWK